MVSVGTLEPRKAPYMICGLTKVRQADCGLLAGPNAACGYDGYQLKPTEIGKHRFLAIHKAKLDLICWELGREQIKVKDGCNGSPEVGIAVFRRLQCLWYHVMHVP